MSIYIINRDQICFIAERIVAILPYIIAILYLLSFLEILICIIFGLFGNYFYYCSARRRIRTWKEKQSLSPLSALGGGSVLLGAIAYIACYFLSTVINFLFI